MTETTEPTYTEYQQEMAKTYHLHPSLFPAEQPEVGEIGHKRVFTPFPAVSSSTVEEQVLRVADAFGVNPRFVDRSPFEADDTAGRDAALAERMEQRRQDIAKRMGVEARHIPLEWLTDEKNGG